MTQIVAQDLSKLARNSIEQERSQPSFPIREMTYFLDGGEKATLVRKQEGGREKCEAGRKGFLREAKFGKTLNFLDLTELTPLSLKQLQLKEKIMLTFERDPIFRVNDQHDLNFNEIRERSMAVVRKLAHYFSHEPVHVSQTRMQLLSVINPGAWTRVGVHYGLFFNTLRGQATSEQFAYWASKGAIALNGITGCFAMTELGHGSNVAGLETTATFDDSSDEVGFGVGFIHGRSAGLYSITTPCAQDFQNLFYNFLNIHLFISFKFVIHTPTLTATKFWIGGAAQTATHSVVFAQLIVRGRRYGVKPFVVQLRNIDTFRLMPGIVIGDIGAKMGRTGSKDF